jgi:hypothetical protein
MKDINHWFVVVTSYNPGQSTLAVFIKNLSKNPFGWAPGPALPLRRKNKKAGQMAGFRRKQRVDPQFT